MTTNSVGIARRIAEARAKAGMSQLELAKAALVAPAQISRYESMKVKPRLVVCMKLAEVLGVDTDWLINGDKDEVDAVDLPAENEAVHPLAPSLARMEALVTQRERELRDAVRLISPVLMHFTEGLDEKLPMPGDPHGRPVGYWRSVFSPAAGGVDLKAGTPADHLSLAITWARMTFAAKDGG